MQAYIKIKEGKIKEKEVLSSLFKLLEDGEYIVTIDDISEKDAETLRKKYFAILTNLYNYTGTDKNDLHEEVKQALNVETTKNFDKEDWYLYIKNVREYYFKQLDIIL